MKEIQILREQVINDYFTANIKAEVIFDTILTPVIEDILSVTCPEKNGDIRLIAKEFPILKDKNKKDEDKKIIVHGM